MIAFHGIFRRKKGEKEDAAILAQKTPDVSLLPGKMTLLQRKGRQPLFLSSAGFREAKPLADKTGGVAVTLMAASGALPLSELTDGGKSTADREG
jgi:hypothetical protein